MQVFHCTFHGDNVHNIYDAVRQHYGVASSEYVSPTGNTFYFNFENFSFWNNSDMSASVLIDIWDPKTCFVKLTVSGGKVGIFRLDIWGREKSRLNKIQSTLFDIAKHYNWNMNTQPHIPVSGPTPQVSTAKPPVPGQG